MVTGSKSNCIYLLFFVLIHVIHSQHETIWYEKMDTLPSLSAWTGTALTLSSGTACPFTTYCWSLNAAATTTISVSTAAFSSVQLTYSVAAAGIKGSPSNKCSMQYSIDGSSYTEILSIADDITQATNTYTAWGNSADYQSQLFIRLVYGGSGHMCSFNEFTLEGILTANPTKSPSNYPSQPPTDNPTLTPSNVPSQSPTSLTDEPSQSPTDDPSLSPTDDPTLSPTDDPSLSPTEDPSLSPTNDPSQSPTAPSVSPTVDPTLGPTAVTIPPTTGAPSQPSLAPIISPTTAPTDPPFNVGPSGYWTCATNTRCLAANVRPVHEEYASTWVYFTGYGFNQGHIKYQVTYTIVGAVPCINPKISAIWERIPKYLSVYLDGDYFDGCSDSSSSCGSTYWCFQNERLRNGGPYYPGHQFVITVSHNSDTACSNNVNIAAQISFKCWGVSPAPTPWPTTPSYTPSNAPSSPPTAAPSFAPTVQSIAPTAAPSSSPTAAPSFSPTVESNAPSSAPTAAPSLAPTAAPSLAPTAAPSNTPSSVTVDPTLFPSEVPSKTPTQMPSKAPTKAPTNIPTVAPTTATPTVPSVSPSLTPTTATLSPTTVAPTLSPTYATTISLHADNSVNVYISSDGSSSSFRLIGSESSWQNTLTLTIDPMDITLFTIIKFEVADAGSIAGFIANVNYNNNDYYTTNPIDGVRYQVISSSDGRTSPLTYTANGAGPWGQTPLPSNAYWIWNGYTHNTMVFYFRFETLVPTKSPTASPTIPTMNPITHAPTLFTTDPSAAPTSAPTHAPSVSPTADPSAAPSSTPSHAPSVSPSPAPSNNPSVSPTLEPTRDPSPAPTSFTMHPSIPPTLSPTYNPTRYSPDVSHMFFMTIVGNYMTARNLFALLIMTRSDNYTRINLNGLLESPLELNKNPSSLSSITELSEYSRCDGSDSECVTFWQIDYTQSCASLQLSGDWKMQFMPSCVGIDYLNKKECLDLLEANDLSTNEPVSLTVSNFEFEDKICDEALYSKEFVPQFTYYKSSSLKKERPETAVYKKGDTVYVKVDAEDVKKRNGFDVSAVDINNVFICALDDDDDDDLDTNVDGNVNEISGCLLSTTTLVVLSDGESRSGFDAGVLSDGAFSFRIPSDIEIEAEEITIQIQATLTVQSSIRRRRLLTTQQAKQMRHFTTNILFNPNAVANKASAGSASASAYIYVLIGALFCLCATGAAIVYWKKKKNERVKCDVESSNDVTSGDAAGDAVHSGLELGATDGADTRRLTDTVTKDAAVIAVDNDPDNNTFIE